MNEALTNTEATEALVREAIQKTAVGPDRGRDISREHAEQLMQAILNGDVDEVQVAVLLIALRMKRESLDEFLGLFDALQANTESLLSSSDTVINLADPFDGYVRTATITPFIPAVLAANGLSCTMHGVESVGPKHGVTAHKVYKLAGIKTDIEPSDACEQLEENGWAYLDQSQYAGALYKLNSLRDRIVKRTALTTLERLLMPIKGARSTHMVLGYVHKAYPEIYARVAISAGYDSVLLMKGVEGGLAPALNKPLRRYYIESASCSVIEPLKQVLETDGLFKSEVSAEPLAQSNDPTLQVLEQGLAVLKGAKGLARDSLCLATANILLSFREATSLADAVENVQACLDNGSAQACFQSLIESS